MNPDFARKLGLKVWKTNIGAQKIDGSALKTFEMIIADFQIEDKANRPRFFQKTFLVANIKFEIILEMLFLKFSNADVSLGEKHLHERLISPTRPYLPSSKSRLLIKRTLL